MVAVAAIESGFSVRRSAIGAEGGNCGNATTHHLNSKVQQHYFDSWGSGSADSSQGDHLILVVLEIAVGR